MKLDTQRILRRIGPWFERVSMPGLLWGTLFFAASLTPSMIPRHFLVQGVLSGLSFALGYGLGVLLERLWDYLHLRRPGAQLLRRLKRAVVAICLVIVVLFLWWATGWQNSVRTALHMPRLTSDSPVLVGLIAFLTFWLLLAIARLIGLVFRLISRRLKRYMPDRAAYLLGFTLAALLSWSVIDGVIFRIALTIADSSYR